MCEFDCNPNADAYVRYRKFDVQSAVGFKFRNQIGQ